MELQYVLLRPEARAPTRAHETDAGFDLYALDDVSLPAGGRAGIATGIAVALPRFHVGLICARSGLAHRYGVTVLNAPGVVDEGYRGELVVLLINTDAAVAHQVRAGNRIAQLVVLPVAPLVAIRVQGLPGTPRGPSGFGSTGA